MARYELTMVDGEKILVDHPIDAMGDMGSHLAGAGFVLFKEIKAGSNLPPKDVIISTAHMALLRPMPEGSTTGSNFRSKR